MNKEQAIEILKAIKKEDDIKYSNYTERYYKALDIAIDSLDNEWVDVRDRLPQENKTYKTFILVTTADGYVTEAEYSEICGEAEFTKFGIVEVGGVDGTGSYDHRFGDEKLEVIAWKPLPKPYERKE